MKSLRPANRRIVIDCLRLGRLLAALLTVSLAAQAVFAQSGSTTRYVYDDNGRLHAVIAPNGEANVYEYDSTGNVTAIRRLNADVLELLDFYPRSGGPGTHVTIIGTGFGAGVNTVAFNGAPAQIVAAGSPSLVVTVPANATTGPISVTTSHGTANTALPFTVRGINVSPPSVALVSGQTIQFTSASVRPEDENVVWSVNGVEGGAPAAGIITSTGSYTAPQLQEILATANFLIRATSAVDSSVFGQAVVTVRNPFFLRWAGAPIISVHNPNAIASAVSFANVISVRNPVTTTASITSFGAPVSVRNSVMRTLTITPFGVPVSVRNGGGSGSVTASWPSPVVSVAIAPTITSVSPTSLSRGMTTTITINGFSLTGVESIQFHSPAGTVDSNITAANLIVNPAGTQMTVTITVSGSAATGRRVIVISSGTTRSQETDIGANRVEIVQ
jgi:YD repeat-containing protein